MLNFSTAFAEISTLTWIILVSLFGGLLSVSLAALFALNLRTSWVPMLVSYAIGAMLGAVFLEILPHAFSMASSVETISITLLLGLFLFFVLEKLVIWRHCHGDHCEVHALHTEANCPDPSQHQAEGVKFRAVQTVAPSILHNHNHAHDHGRSGLMIMIGDTFHNFIDGILIAAAFMVDVKLGMVTALAIIAHEIPQEVGDFLILLHSGYSKKQALVFNLVSSLATLAGGLIAYFALQYVESWIPIILGLAASSMLYVAVADLIPGLHKRTELKATISQVLLIGFGVGTIWLAHITLA
jgi:zinc and cadmium transporter